MSIPSPQEAQTRFLDGIYRPRTTKLSLPFDNLDNGLRVLNEEAECDRYITLYGAHHFHKLYAAFASTNFQYTGGKTIEIIDWGCGQALATCVLLDYLIEKRISPDIVSITLIEPSSLGKNSGRGLDREQFSSKLAA